jgi:hypothetical protein
MNFDLSEKDRNRLRFITRHIALSHDRGHYMSLAEIDRFIDNIGPKIQQDLLRKHVDRGDV